MAYFILPLLEEEPQRFICSLYLSRLGLIISIAAGFLYLYQIRARIFSMSLSPYTLAVFRIVFFGFVSIGFTAPLYITGASHVPFPWADIPTSERIPLPFIEWYVQHVPITPSIAAFTVKIIALSAFACMIGFGTRYFSLIFLLATFYLNGFQNFFGKMNHNHFIVWFAAILCFTRCADVLSIDALTKKIRKQETIKVPANYYSLPVIIVWLLIGIIYFFPGFHKMWSSGLDWALTDNVRNQIYLKYIELNGWEAPLRIDQIPILYKAAGLFALAFEIGFVFIIFHHRYRPLAIFSGVLFHTTTYLIFGINFFYLLMCYVVFIDWEQVFETCNRVYPIRVISNTLVGMKNIRVGIFNSEVSFKGSGLLLAVGIILISLNSFAGIFKINSWPIACFPLFENLVDSQTEVYQYKLISGSKATYLDKAKMAEKYTSYIYRQWEFNLSSALQKSDSLNIERYGQMLVNRALDTYNVTNADSLYLTSSVVLLTDSGYTVTQSDMVLFKIKISDREP